MHNPSEGCSGSPAAPPGLVWGEWKPCFFQHLLHCNMCCSSLLMRRAVKWLLGGLRRGRWLLWSGLRPLRSHAPAHHHWRVFCRRSLNSIEVWASVPVISQLLQTWLDTQSECFSFEHECQTFQWYVSYFQWRVIAVCRGNECFSKWDSESGSEWSAHCMFLVAAVNVFQKALLMVIIRREFYWFNCGK